MTPVGPTFAVGPIRLLNVPFAAAAAREVWDDDVYRLSDIPDGSAVIDVGAFYGEFGLICRAGKNCRVLALEPSPVNYEVLLLNLSINEVEAGFRPWNAAVLHKSEGRPFYHRSDHPAGGSSTPLPGATTNIAYGVSMNNVVAAAAQFGDEFVVKLDVEGAEREVFDADLAWLSAVSIVTMEWHNHDGDRYAAILHAHGFNVDVTGGGPPPRPPWDPSIKGGLLFARRP